MILSSFCVVTNALRLNMLHIHDSKKDKSLKRNRQIQKTEHKEQATILSYKNKEELKMEKTMKIEGMMCGHCEATVKKCLEALPEVTEAKVSHEAGTAVVTLSGEISEEILKKTVEEKDYKVLSIN